MVWCAWLLCGCGNGGLAALGTTVETGSAQLSEPGGSGVGGTSSTGVGTTTTLPGDADGDGVTDDVDTCPGLDDAEWDRMPDGTRCATADVELRTWEGASAECQQRGGQLVRIDTAQDNNFALSLYAAASAGSFHIGFTDALVEGSFGWMDGGPVNFTNWASGEPNDVNGEDCTTVYETGEWNDVPCVSGTVVYGHVCQVVL